MDLQGGEDVRDLRNSVVKSPSVYFDQIIVETPLGVKHTLNPVYAWVDDDKDSLDQFLLQFLDLAAELEELQLYMEVMGQEPEFLERLKQKGYKVHFPEAKQDG